MKKMGMLAMPKLLLNSVRAADVAVVPAAIR